jgi:hypothetical protein
LLAKSGLAPACDDAWQEFTKAPSEENLGYAITSSVDHECALSNATVDALADRASSGGLLETRGALAATSFVEGGNLELLLRVTSKSIRANPGFVITAYLKGTITKEVFFSVLVAVPDEYIDDMPARIRELIARRAAIAKMTIDNEPTADAISQALRTIDEQLSWLEHKARELPKR